jgi:hypothetical protein
MTPPPDKYFTLIRDNKGESEARYLATTLIVMKSNLASLIYLFILKRIVITSTLQLLISV